MAIPIPIPTRLRSSSTSAPKSSSSPLKYPGGLGTWSRSSRDTAGAGFSSSPTGVPPVGTPPLPHTQPSRSRTQQQQLARDSVRRECARIAKLVAQREDHFEKVVTRLNRFISAEQDRAIKDVAKTLKQMLTDEKLLRKEIEGLEAMRISRTYQLLQPSKDTC